MSRLSSALSRWLHYASCMALALLMFLTVGDIIGRYMLNQPVPGTFELTEISMVFIVFLALGIAHHEHEHISLDLAYNFFPPWLKQAVDLLVALISLAVIAAITWQLYLYSLRMLEGGYTTAVLRLPIHPFVLVAVVGTTAYALAIITDCGDSIRQRWSK